MGQEGKNRQGMASKMTAGGEKHPSQSLRTGLFAALWAAGVVVADQAAKFLARHFLTYGEPREIIPGFFNLALVFNRGAAWGMMAGFRFFFVALAIAMLALIAFKWRVLFNGALGRVSGILLSGGILGNAIDRAVFGYVTDFIDLWHGTYHFPCFNIADSAICIGVALYFFVRKK